MPKLLIAGKPDFTSRIVGLLHPMRGKFTITNPHPSAIAEIAVKMETEGHPFDAIIVFNRMCPTYGHLLPRTIKERGGCTPVIVVCELQDERFFGYDCVMLFSENLTSGTLRTGIERCARVT